MSQWMVKNRSQRGQGMLSVPVRLVKIIPDGARFEPELTDEGLLYRFVGIVERNENGGRGSLPVDVPEWAQ